MGTVRSDRRGPRGQRQTTGVLRLARALVLAVTVALPLAAQSAWSASAADAISPSEPQRVELPEIGLAASLPAGWHVLTPLQPRASWYDRGADDDTPVYAWSGIFATGGEGRWCGIDRYEDFPWTLDEHATFLERWNVSGSLNGRTGGYEPVELRAGPAWRIDVDDERKGRSSRLYLLAYDEDQVLLTCADDLGSSEDWLDVAQSIELGPRQLSAQTAIAESLAAAHAD